MSDTELMTESVLQAWLRLRTNRVSYAQAMQEFDAWLKKHDEKVILRHRVDAHRKLAKSAMEAWWEDGDVNDITCADFHEDQANILERKINNDN